MAKQKSNEAKKEDPVTHRVGVFDSDNVLVGERAVKRMTSQHVAIGDLPTNGRYKLVDGQFVPVGHGFGKPETPPISMDRALFLTIRALVGGLDLPAECRQWADWYEANLGARTP